MNNKNKIIVISSISIIIVLALCVFLIFSKNSSKNEDKAKPVTQTETGQIVVDPAYNVLTPTDSKDFKKLYCQDLAESRVINLTLENNQKSAELIRQAADSAKKENDNDTSVVLTEFAQATADYDPNSSKSLVKLVSYIDKIENISKDNCNIIYFSHPTDENIQKARELATTPVELPQQTPEELVNAIEQQKLLEEMTNSKNTIQMGSFTVNANPSLYTQPYCAPLANMIKKVSLGGLQKDLIARLRVGYKNILVEMNKSTVSPTTKQGYVWLAEYYNTHEYLPVMVGPTPPEYIKSFTIMREDAKKTCGITYTTE